MSCDGCFRKKGEGPKTQINITLDDVQVRKAICYQCPNFRVEQGGAWSSCAVSDTKQPLELCWRNYDCPEGRWPMTKMNIAHRTKLEQMEMAKREQLARQQDEQLLAEAAERRANEQAGTQTPNTYNTTEDNQDGNENSRTDGS